MDTDQNNRDDLPADRAFRASAETGNEAERFVWECRSQCAAYRVNVSRGARQAAQENLVAIRLGLQLAAQALATALGRPLPVDLEMIAFDPADPYAAAFAAEAALEPLCEELDRLAWRKFRAFCGQAATGARLVWLCLAVVLLAAILVAGTKAYQAHERRLLTLDVLAEANPPQFHTTGINTVTETASENRAWRWAYGPQTELWFQSDREAMCYLVVSVYNLASGQVLTISANGQNGESFAVPVTGFEKTNGVLRLPFMSKVGQNIIRISNAAWNHQTEDFAPQDPRPLSVAYAALRIEPRD
jgi:hypothetical protein